MSEILVKENDEKVPIQEGYSRCRCSGRCHGNLTEIGDFHQKRGVGEFLLGISRISREHAGIAREFPSGGLMQISVRSPDR